MDDQSDEIECASKGDGSFELKSNEIVVDFLIELSTSNDLIGQQGRSEKGLHIIADTGLC